MFLEISSPYEHVLVALLEKIKKQFPSPVFTNISFVELPKFS